VRRQRLAQRARRQIGPLRDEQDLFGIGQADPPFAGAPHAGRGAEQRDLRGVVLARDEHARAVRDLEIEIVDQHAAVDGRAQREVVEGDRSVGLLDDRDRRRGRARVHPLGEAAQAREHGRRTTRSTCTCVTISENAPIRCENAIADCVITPNSTWSRMNSGPTISAGMIWIR
jgi:hypothetical protein